MRRFDMKFWAGIGVSLFFLGLLFRKMDFAQMGAVLRTVDYRYVALAVILTFCSYFFRALRWKYLLAGDRQLPLASLYSATIIGYMANNLLPARLGEFVRAYVLAQKESMETPEVFASLVIDRLCDGFTVMLILVVTVLTMQFPAGMEDVSRAVKSGGMVTFGVYCGIIVFLVVLKRRTAMTLELVGWLLRPFPARVSERLIPLLGSFIAGIRLSSRSGHLLAIVGTSLMTWLFATWPIDIVLRAFGIELPITASMFIMILLVFAVMVPASPGYIGTYHYACVKGLSVFGLPESTAVGIALIIHATGFFPVIVAGFFHLSSSNLNLSKLSRASNKD